MTDANTLRRLNYLWKNRHDHDDDTTQDQIDNILKIIERGADTPSVTAAYIHLTRNATQTIGVSGEEVSWDTVHPLIDPVGFADPILPVTEVTIPFEAYYGVKFESKWSSYTDGGTVEVRRERNGNTVRLWPTDDDPDLWTATDGQRFSGIAVIPCKRGDKVSVFLDHDDVSSQDLAKATLTVWKVETSALRQFYKAVVLAAGPIAYWRLDETSGTNAADSAGHASGPFDGTYTNTPTLNQTGVMQDGSASPSVDFDGTNEHVAGVDWADLEFTGTAAFSVEAWFNTDTVAAGQAIIVHKQVASSGNGWELVRSGSTLVASRIGNAGVDVQQVSGGSLSVDTDYYGAVTFDGTTMRLYLNGAEIDSNGTAISQDGNTVTLDIGYDAAGAANGFDGQIDEVAIYDRALSATEIVEHYNVGRGVS